MRYLFVLLCILFTFPYATLAQGQKKSTLELTGSVSDVAGGKKLPGVRITIFNKSVAVDSIKTSSEGDFKYNFDMQQEYLMVFEKKGFIKKKIILNTEMANLGNRIITNYFDYSFQLSGKISSNYGGELVDKPILKIIYNPQSKLFDFDVVYGKRIKAELSALTSKQVDELIAKREAEASGTLVAEKPKTIPAASPVTTAKPAASTPPLKATEQPVAAKPKDPIKPIPEKTQPPTTPAKPTAAAPPVKSSEQPVVAKPKEPTKPIPVELPKKPIDPPVVNTPVAIKPTTVPRAEHIAPSKTIADSKTYISIPAYKAETGAALKNELAKVEIKRQEESRKKTITEIVDRKKAIYETFLQQKVMKHYARKQKANKELKYATGNPLTSFYDATDYYEMQLKNKKAKVSHD